MIEKDKLIFQVDVDTSCHYLLELDLEKSPTCDPSLWVSRSIDLQSSIPFFADRYKTYFLCDKEIHFFDLATSIPRITSIIPSLSSQTHLTSTFAISSSHQDHLQSQSGHQHTLLVL